MDEEDYKYKVITDEAKARLRDMDVVLPSIYASIFANIAKEYQYEMSAEEDKSNDIMDEKLRQYNDMSKQTSEHVDKLSQNTNKAIDAINHKDEALLKQTLAETELLRKEIEELKGMAYLDPLTKVYNRKWLEVNCLEKGYILNSNGVMALIDLNYFKDINDTFGHITGDKVLVFIAAHLRRTGGHVIRYGGDEFLIIFPEDVLLKEAAQKLHISREIVIKRKLKLNDDRFTVSFSIGLVSFSKGAELSDIIEAADVEMYADKAKIKKRIRGI